MVETIAPVVHGGRNRSYYLSVATHTIGSTGSAALFGLGLGALGILLGAPYRNEVALGAIAAVAGVYALRELGGLKMIPLPDLDRQVPDWWRTFFAPPVASFLYGTGLGVGFLTYLSFGTLVPVAAGAVVLGEPVLGAALMAPFGLARGLSVLITRRAMSPEETVDRLGAPELRRAAELSNGATLSAIVLVAIVTLVS